MPCLPLSLPATQRVFQGTNALLLLLLLLPPAATLGWTMSKLARYYQRKQVGYCRELVHQSAVWAQAHMALAALEHTSPTQPRRGATRLQLNTLRFRRPDQHTHLSRAPNAALPCTTLLCS